MRLASSALAACACLRVAVCEASSVATLPSIVIKRLMTLYMHGDACSNNVGINSSLQNEEQGKSSDVEISLSSTFI